LRRDKSTSLRSSRQFKICGDTSGRAIVNAKVFAKMNLINFRNGTVYLDFDRKAPNFEDAVISAIKSVENTSLNMTVISVAPDYYVSESEVAERLHVKRQTVSFVISVKKNIEIKLLKSWA